MCYFHPLEVYTLQKQRPKIIIHVYQVCKHCMVASTYPLGRLSVSPLDGFLVILLDFTLIVSSILGFLRKNLCKYYCVLLIN